MFHLITCIVERGHSKVVVDAAIKAGAQAATFFSAQGRGLKEKLGTFGKFIIPEKEVIMIVTKQEQTNIVFPEICKAARLEVPGKGFAFVQRVEQCVGFVE